MPASKLLAGIFFKIKYSLQ